MGFKVYAVLLAMLTVEAQVLTFEVESSSCFVVCIQSLFGKTLILQCRMLADTSGRIPFEACARF